MQKDQIAIDFVKYTIAKLLREMDTNKDGFISHAEFITLAANEEVRDALETLSVDVDNFVSLSDFLFNNPDTGTNDKMYSHQEFLSMVLSMRTTNTCRVLDIVSLRKLITKCFQDHKGIISSNKSQDEADIAKVKGVVEEFVERLTRKVDGAMQRLDHRITVMEERGKHI